MADEKTPEQPDRELEQIKMLRRLVGGMMDQRRQQIRLTARLDALELMTALLLKEADLPAWSEKLATLTQECLQNRLQQAADVDKRSGALLDDRQDWEMDRLD